jgi:hypothetical protein
MMVECCVVRAVRGVEEGDDEKQTRDRRERKKKNSWEDLDFKGLSFPSTTVFYPYSIL